MQDLRTKRHVVFSFHLHLVFIYILVYILALLLEMSKSLSRLLSGTSPGIYANYYKISIYLKKNFMSLYPAPSTLKSKPFITFFHHYYNYVTLKCC